MPETAKPLRPTVEPAAARAVERDGLLLAAAVAGVSRGHALASLADVAEALPLAASVELAMIRVADETGALHLLAAAGVPVDAVRRRALVPISVGDLNGRSEWPASGAVDLGLVWGRVLWIGPGPEPLGALLVGSRTARRPSDREEALLGRVVSSLAFRMREFDRRPQTVAALSRSFLARHEDGEAAIYARLAQLRPRESTILRLYADRLTTEEVASALVISPETVRTHVKNALRRLGVHTRSDAIALLSASLSDGLL